MFITCSVVGSFIKKNSQDNWISGFRDYSHRKFTHVLFSHLFIIIYTFYMYNGKIFTPSKSSYYRLSCITIWNRSVLFNLTLRRWRGGGNLCLIVIAHMKIIPPIMTYLSIVLNSRILNTTTLIACSSHHTVSRASYGLSQWRM
jgi:hypothetical protein